MRGSDGLQFPLFVFALYGNASEKNAFLLTLGSVLEQWEICQQIMLPESMQSVVSDAGLWKENMIFIPSSSENSFLRSAIRRADAPYMVIGDTKISYVKKTFGDMLAILEETGADFITEMVWHHNFGEPQAVLLSEIAFRSQQSGCEFNEFLSMDRLLANKFFRTDFLQSFDFFEDQSILSQLPEMYQKGYYQFRREYMVVYNGEESTYSDYIADGVTENFIRNYIKDKSVGLEDPCSIPDKKETLMKLMDYPVKKRSDRIFRKILSFLKRRRVKDRVLFISIRKEGELEGNAKALYPYVRGNKKIYAKELPHNRLTQLRMCYYIFTSRIIVTDDYIRYLRYFLLDETQRVVQLWHACGAFKKFGRREQKREAFDGAAHAQYNIVSVSSEKVRGIYADALQVDPNRVRALGVPRTDLFFDLDFIQETKERIYQVYSDFRNKKILVYAPTFRGGLSDRKTFCPKLDFEQLSKELPADQIFVVCPHPVMKNDIVEEHYDNIRVVRRFSTNEMMFVSDMLITDYSSVIFEYVLLKKPILFFCYDLAEYDRGFYLRYPEDLPGEMCESQEELVRYLHSPDLCLPGDRYHTFTEKYMSACDGHSCERIAELINSYREES